MSLHRHFLAVLIVSILIGTAISSPLIAEETSGDWLRGAGKDLQIRVRGEVLESDGQPANDIKLTVSLYWAGSSSPIDPKIDGHRFEFWVPVNQSNWGIIRLKAASAKGDRIAYHGIGAYELRQTALDGIKLTLKSPTRDVQVKVIEKGQPVAGATVKAEFGYSIELRTRTNADGIAHFGLLPDQELADLMAWTDDLRVGGYQFHQMPARDPGSNQHVIELSRCRDRKLRLVDDVGSPVAGLNFVVQVATAPPNLNYIGINEHSRLTTNDAGEAIYKWFPDWDAPHFYVEPRTDQWSTRTDAWSTDGEHELIDGADVFKLNKRKIAVRKRVLGRVVLKNKGVGGVCVNLNSFQSELEHRSDRIQAFTNANGAFSVEVIQDATYYAYVQDLRWVSEIIDFIPYESATDQVAHRVLALSEGEPVEVTVVSGPQKKPISNMSISFRREHRFQWQENGETRRGEGAADWWATTDESGRAFTRTVPGKLKASVYTSSWRTEQTVNVTSGVPAKILLHREVDEK